MATYYVYCKTGNTTRYSRVAWATDYEMSPDQKAEMETDMGVTVDDPMTIEIADPNDIGSIEFDENGDLVLIDQATATARNDAGLPEPE